MNDTTYRSNFLRQNCFLYSHPYLIYNLPINSRARFFSTDNSETNNITAYKYNHSLYKPFSVHIRLDKVFENNFMWSELKEVLEIGEKYYIGIKVFFRIPSENEFDNTYDKYDYKTSGEQILLNYLSSEKLYSKINVISKRVKDVISEYSMDSDNVEYVLLEVRRLKWDFYTDITLDNESVNKKDSKFLTKAIQYIPLTTDKAYLGEPLKDVEIDNGIVTSLNINDEGSHIDIIKNIENNSINFNKDDKPNLVFDSDYQFYLRDIDNQKYILCIKECGDGITDKKAIDIHTGDKIKECRDRVSNNGEVVREIKGRNITISDNKVQSEIRKLDLKPISSYTSNIKKDIAKFTGGEKQNFGVFDLETWTDPIIKNNARYTYVYAGGIYIKNKVLDVKYAEKGVISHQIVLDMLDLMFDKEYRGYEWYCHNFSKFDSYFFLGAIEWHNEQQHDDKCKYKMSVVTRDGFIIKLSVSKFIKNSWIRINLKDSIPILPYNLRDLAESFDISEKKGHFPYNFVNENTLFYIGDLPDKKYFNSITDEEYNNLTNSQWSLKEMCIEYTKKDLFVLFDVMTVANKKFYNYYNIQMTDTLTISRMALNLFKKKILQKE